MKMECCAAAHGTDFGLLWRSLRALVLTIWRAVTLPYADTLGVALFTLTFLWVLVFKRGTVIYHSEDDRSVTLRRAV